MTNLKCPACSSEDTLPMAYGLPSPETKAMAERGEVVIGGCNIWPDMPDRECRSCGKRFRSDPIAQQRYDEETAHQLARLAAFKRGHYLVFDHKTQSPKDIADAINRMRERTMREPEPNDTGTTD